MTLEVVTLVLPFPPSVNELYKNARRGRVKSEKYNAWISEANVAILQQKRAAGSPIKGNFTYHVVLDEKRRRWNSDGDNRSSKAILDMLQRANLIENDCFADAGSWSWGPCDPDMCFVRVYKKGLQAA